MIDFKKITLPNGLRVLVHTDKSSPTCTVNIRYNVGARNERQERTGFAHLFEHLMFSGSKNVENFDDVLQRVGAQNNAYTTNDYTNYFINTPTVNLETALYVEADRMADLTINAEKLDIQRNVVIEEFHQRVSNVPYGNLAHLNRDLVYKVHPYRWPTIGLKTEHIAEASLDEVRAFYEDNYAPDNAILAVCGDVEADEVFQLVEKYFGGITRQSKHYAIPQEPTQTAFRELTVQRNVPADCLAMTFHIGGRLDRSFYVFDLITDVLADGDSARLVQRLTRDERLLSDVDATVSGSLDPGILTLSGTFLEGTTKDDILRIFWEELDRIKRGEISEAELQKVKNRMEAMKIFREISCQVKATNLCTCEAFGNVDLINNEAEIYNTITIEEIQQMAHEVCTQENCSVLYYQKK